MGQEVNDSGPVLIIFVHLNSLGTQRDIHDLFLEELSFMDVVLVIICIYRDDFVNIHMTTPVYLQDNIIPS